MQNLKFKLNISRESWVVFIITVVAFGLRLFRLGLNDFWYDEVYSIYISENFLSDWNPPVYFGILHFWIKIFGTSEFAVRFPSLIFSVASIPCLFLLGKRLFNARTGLYAAALMCLSAFHLWYAQEARPYSLIVFLSILSTCYLYRFITEGKIKSVFIFILLSILGFYSDVTYYFLFLLAVQLLILAISIRKKLLFNLLLLFGIIFLIFSFRLERFISKFNYVRGGFWIPVPDLKSLIITIENFNLGYNASQGLYWVSDLAALFILVTGFLAIRKKNELRRKFIFVAVFIFLPAAFIFTFSKIIFPVYLDRALIIFSPYYYLLLAFGLSFLPKGRLKYIVIFSFLAALFISIFYYYYNIMPLGFRHHVGVHLKKPIKPVLRFIEGHSDPDDIVMHTNPSTYDVFNFYSLKKAMRHNFLFVSGMIDSDWNRPYSSGGLHFSVADIHFIKSKRIWVVSCAWDRGKEMDENSKAVNSAMNNLYKMDLNLESEGLWVYRYVNI